MAERVRQKESSRWRREKMDEDKFEILKMAVRDWKKQNQSRPD